MDGFSVLYACEYVLNMLHTGFFFHGRERVCIINHLFEE
jgi:hypothetical protein